MPRPPPRPSPHVPPPADHVCTIHGHDCKIPPDPLPAGASGPFSNHRHLASGAFGRVYSSHSACAKGAPDTALKVISKCTLGTSSAARSALRAEVDIQKTLNHPHIVALRDVLQDAHRVYLVLDYVPGPCLADLIADRGPLPEATVRVFFAHLCRGLAHLHSLPNPILHRDVKPANVLLPADLSTVLLCDFGLAQRLETAGHSPHPAPAALSLVGTPNFLSPEIVDAASATGSAASKSLVHPAPLAVDVYAAGVVLYMMLTGCAPFDAQDVPRTFRRIRAGRLVFPQRIDISSNARALVKALLARNPSMRPSIAAVLASPFLNPLPLAPSSHQLLPADPQRVLPKLASDRRFDAPVVDSFHGNVASASSSFKGTPLGAPEGRRLSEAPGARARSKSTAAAHQGLPNGKNHNVPSSHHDSGLSGQQEQRRYRSDTHSRVAADGRESRVDDLVGGADASANLPVPAPQSRGLAMPSYGRQGSMPASMLTGVSPRKIQKRTAMTAKHHSNQREEPDARVREQFGRVASGRSAAPARHEAQKRRPLSGSMSRCISMYKRMLDTMNDGLEAAKKQLNDDAAVGVSDTAAFRRFQLVSRRLANDDPRVPMMVARWLDWSTSHGFATRMADGRTGCCFNDSSIMFNWSVNRGVPDVAYASAADRGIASRQGVASGASMTPRSMSTSVSASKSRRIESSVTAMRVQEADGASSFSPEVAALGRPQTRRHESTGTAQATRATFKTSRIFRNEITEKAKLLCRFSAMFDDEEAHDAGRDESSTISDDGDGCLGFDAATPMHVEPVGGSSSSSCSISFLGEDDAERDPGCTESLLRVRGLDDSKLVHVRGWQRYKSPRAVAFRLSNDCIHVKIDLARHGDVERYEEDFVLNARRQVIFYRGLDGDGWECDINDIDKFCFSKRFHARVSFCSRVLSRFVSQK